MNRDGYQVVDVVRLAEQEFGQPFDEVVRGFAGDGESVRSISRILHCDEMRLRRYMRRRGIAPDPALRLPYEHPVETRRKIAVTLRRRSGRPPVEWRGQTWTYRELENETGIPADTIRMRLRNGWTVAESVSTPVGCERRGICK